MENVRSDLVTVGRVHPRRRKLLLTGSIIAVIIIGTIGIVFLTRYFASRQNQFDHNEFDDLETETTVQTGTNSTTSSLMTASSTTMPGTIYISYIRSGLNIQSNISFLLASTLIYNSEDEIEYDGYVTTINITLYELFTPFGTTDCGIHFHTILNNNILSSISLLPSRDFLINTFKISPWKLIVKPGSFLCVSRYSGDISFMENSYEYGSKISTTQSGKAYSSSNFSSPDSKIEPEWNGENIGIALSFTIAHNPIWNGTTPSPTTPRPYQNSTYGSVDKDILDESVPLNSYFYFNWFDECRETAYIININIRFCRPFQKENTLDSLLWFFTININGDVRSTYSVIPENISLTQSFNIPYREFIIYPGFYLSVGTFSNNFNSNNTICLREVGSAYSFELIYNISNQNIIPQWRGFESGIALSYAVTTEGVTTLCPDDGMFDNHLTESP